LAAEGPLAPGPGNLPESVCGARRDPSSVQERWERLGSEDPALDESLLAGMGSGTPGLLITFEGADGTGKSTQMALLAEALREHGYPVLTTREPGGTALGESVRRLLLDAAHTGMSPRAEALLYTAARAQLVEEVIRPALGAGTVVLCDRYLDSSLAYQGSGRDLGVDNMMMLSVWATDCLFPDLTLVFFVAEDTRRSRMRHEGDRLEREDDAFFARVDEGYRKLVSDHPHRIRAVEGEGEPAQVQARVRALVDEELGLFRQEVAPAS
jgi:dTMP kinase